MTHAKISTALAVIALTGIAASLATASSSAKHTDRFSYANVNAIALDNTQGHIHITTGHTSVVKVERTAQTLFTHVTNSSYVSGHVLHLSSRCHGSVCQVDFQIHTPPGIRLQVNNQNATVSISGAPGDVSIINTGEGDLAFDLTRAPHHLSASTQRGEIDITIPRGAYAITARTNNGNKTITGITLNRHAHHTLRASANSGDITINGH